MGDLLLVMCVIYDFTHCILVPRLKAIYARRFYDTFPSHVGWNIHTSSRQHLYDIVTSLESDFDKSYEPILARHQVGARIYFLCLYWTGLGLYL